MVGVLLERDPDPIGEWLAVAAAFAAAGADALCVDCRPEPEGGWLDLAAAPAAVAYAARLVVPSPDGGWAMSGVDCIRREAGDGGRHTTPVPWSECGRRGYGRCLGARLRPRQGRGGEAAPPNRGRHGLALRLPLLRGRVLAARV